MQTKNYNRPLNNPATPGKSGGWIHRMLLVNGTYVCRDKVNIPQNFEFYNKIKEITTLTASQNIKMGALELYNARLDIYTANGKQILLTIGCTKEQSALFV